jgi:hypothetical protein
MDAARMAAQSDPDRNPNFRRRWGPPLERSGTRVVPTTRSAKSKDSSSDTDNTRSARLLQWAFRLDRVADAELAVGRFHVAERLAHQAQELRETLG